MLTRAFEHERVDQQRGCAFHHVIEQPLIGDGAAAFDRVTKQGSRRAVLRLHKVVFEAARMDHYVDCLDQRAGSRCLPLGCHVASPATRP
ncbi:MAG: hypothetical protein CMJ21_05605 [Phycisphaerae bacterium]|nr:hypothetical protein [Phycisphaerae bacterium]